jgi:hypothetical protein
MQHFSAKLVLSLLTLSLLIDHFYSVLKFLRILGPDGC